MKKMDVEIQKRGCSLASCPMEIYINIFKYLNARDLLACRGSSKRCRNAADFCGQRFNKWETLVRDCMHNRGVTYLQKSTLDCKDLYFNSLMWTKAIHSAKVDLRNVYQPEKIVQMRVYKDNLIVICKDYVRYYHIIDGTIVKEITGQCADYQETDYFILQVNLRGQEKDMILDCKLHKKKYKNVGIKNYCLQHNKLYITDELCYLVLYQCTPENCTAVPQARLYASPLLMGAMFMYKDDVYLYVTKGDVYRHRDGALGFEHVCKAGDNIPAPPGALSHDAQDSFRAIFHGKSILYAVASKEDEKVIRNYTKLNGNENLLVLYADLTYAIEHGDILLLGFKDGKVGIVDVTKLWATNDLRPVFQFYIHDVAQEEVEPIRGIEVFEAEGCHHVFVLTSKTYHIIISHDYTKVIP